MELTFTTNSFRSVKIREATLNGRKYLVAPLALITPGVLAGSKGRLFYPPEETHRNIEQWNGMPLTVNHPVVDGINVSARSAKVLDQYAIGTVLNSRITPRGKLGAEGWFDIELTQKKEPRILEALRRGQPIELSTGLFTDNYLAANGSNHNGKSYTHVAKNYRADHVAILVDQQGACSLRDGCGVLIDNCKTGENAGKPGPCPTGGTEPNKHGANVGAVGSEEEAKAFTDKHGGTFKEQKNAYGKTIGYGIHAPHDADETLRIEFTRALFRHKQSKGKPTANWSEAARIAAILARRTGRSAKRLVKTAIKGKVNKVKSEVQRVRDAIAKKGQSVVDKVKGKGQEPPPLPKRDKAKATPPPLPQKKDKPKPPPLPQKKDTTPYEVKEAEKQGKRSAIPEVQRVKKAIKVKREKPQATHKPPQASTPKPSGDRVKALREQIAIDKERTAKAKSESSRIKKEMKNTRTPSNPEAKTLRRKIGAQKGKNTKAQKKIRKLQASMRED
jgi:hypothetical protein